MEKKSNYTLPDIAEWTELGLVSLPAVQRGFVWRPSQIENLWDSLLRGYPIGAFVMSPKENNGSFEMLDGQQRATSICLGFGKETFRDSQDKIKVFIDLDKPKGDDNRKYIFRVITRSHPWGYQKTDNTKTLISDNIRKAMNLYDEEDHLEADLNKFYPYDASLPIPFNLFIEAAVNNDNIDQLLIKINQESNWKKIAAHWNEKNEKILKEIHENPESKKDQPELSSKEKINERINEIYLAVKNMLHLESGQKIPALYLDFEKFKRGLDNSQSDKNIGKDSNDDTDDIEDEGSSNDEIENLFIRLNAGGTPLRGEELNYSILKANIPPQLQHDIEEACNSLFRPSRFITIAFRLFQHWKKQEQSDALTMRIKPKQFQKTVNENKSLAEFSQFLKDIISNKAYNNNTLLQYAKSVLEYNETDNKYGLPYLITSKIAADAPEVMFMFLFRLMIWKDEFKFDSELHRKMLGIITLFMWFGKGEKQRDHAKLISNIWPGAKYLNNELFWSSSTVQRAMLNDALIKFPSFRSLIKIKKYAIRSNTDLRVKFNQDTNYGSFLNQIFFKYDLVLYVQRHFLSNVFKETQYHLDDTNVPFDWDHISPHKYVSKKKGIPRILRDWYESNGNYRAWPYSMNRMDQDNVPALKLDPLNRENYNAEGNESYEVVEKRWRPYMEKESIQSARQLRQTLLEKSFCSKEWADCRSNNMKKKTDWEDVSKLIIDRNLSICKEWYSGLRIDDLMPYQNESFSSIIDNRKYEKNKMKKEFDFEGINWVSKPISIGKSKVSFFIIYNEDMNEILDEDSILFGIYQDESIGFIKSIKISDRIKDSYVTDRSNYILGYFTLISHDEGSYLKLLQDFSDWLKNFPNHEIKNLVIPFVNSLSTKYKNKLHKTQK